VTGFESVVADGLTMLAFVYCLLAFVVFVAGMATWMCSRLQP
jgi:hypothetical protein